jgi:hypothetical protein
VRKLLTVVGLVLASLVSAGAALADPAVHEVPPDDVFVDVNPCTGELTTITNSFKSFVIREGTDAAGGFHVTGTGVGTITTADGFSGRFTFWFGFNSTKSGTTIETFTNSNTLGNGTGQRILVTVAFHVTIVSGEVTVEREHVNFRCVGKPA